MSSFVIYRSSAGSGKTYTLVKEYLMMILQWDNPTYYRKILAITFTNKAASELKERIIKQLMGMSGVEEAYQDKALVATISEELNLTPVDLKKRSAAVLQHMMYNYGDLAVSTIDKFVVKILRFFNKELDLQADFSVELNTKKIIALAVERMLDRIGKDPLLTKMAFNFSQQKVASDKSWRIEKDLNTIAELLNLEEGHHAAQLLQAREEVALLEALKKRKLYLKEMQRSLEELGERARDVLAENEEAIKFIPAAISKFFNTLGLDATKGKVHPTDATMKRLENDAWHLKNKGQHAEELVEELRRRLFPIYQQSMKIIQSIVLEQLLIQSFAPLIFAKRIYQEIQDVKEEQNLVLISDNNLLISDVIRDNPSPFIYEKLGERFRHFMIDEFQDTSILQWHNLIPLVEESLAAGNKNILVGDSKQSIYRFRGGEMEQLARLPKIYNKESYHQSTEHVFENLVEEKKLAYNYRSRKEIVTFNNQLFEFMLQGRADRLQLIYRDFLQIPKRNTGGAVVMKPVEDDQKETMVDAVVSMVERSMALGYRYRDVAVLVYKNDIGQLVAEALRKKNIPIVSMESLLLKKQANIQLMIALLNYMVQPENNKYRLKIAQYIYANKMTSNVEVHDFYKKYLSKESHFEKIFDDYHIDFDREHGLGKDVYALCEKLCKSFALNSTEAYMIEFLNICSGFVNKEKGNVHSFLEYWEINSYRLALQLSDTLDAVHILTVHKSKGLEFPVVINPYYFSRPKTYSKKFLWIKDEADSTPLLLPTNKSATYTSYAPLIEEEAYKTQVDALNLLYVATTRATELLFLLFPLPNEAAVKANKTMAVYLHNFAMTQGEETKDGEFVWGDILPVEKTADTAEAEYWIQDYDRLDWNSELRIAISDELKGDELTFGNRLHELIATTNSPDEIESNMKRFLQKNYLKEKDQKRLEESLHSVFKLETFRQWHDTCDSVINEREILHVNGKTLRPDRIFVWKDKVVVVDFKTGVARNSHHKQVAEYAEAMNELGYVLVEGFLLYTTEPKLVPVDCEMRLL